MAIVNAGAAVLDEKIWSAWVHKAQLRERRTARRIRLFATGLACVLVVGAAAYFLK